MPALRAPSARAGAAALARAGTASLAGANVIPLAGVHAAGLATRLTPVATRSTETKPESRGFSAADEHDTRSGNDRQCDDEDFPHIVLPFLIPDLVAQTKLEAAVCQFN